MSSSSLISNSVVRPASDYVRHRHFYIAMLIVVDALMLGLAFLVAFWLRFEMGVTISPEVASSPQRYRGLAAVFLPVWLGIFATVRLYDIRILLGGTEEYTRIFNACTTSTMIVIVIGFLNPTFVIARAWLLLSWPLSVLLVSFGRMAMRRVAYGMRKNGYFVTPALVVGVNGEARALAEQLRNSRYSGLKILGMVNAGPDDPNTYRASGTNSLPVLGEVDDLPSLIQTHGAVDVIVSTTALEQDKLLTVFRQVTSLPGVQLRLSSGLYEVLTTGMEVTTVGSVPLMSLKGLRLDRTELFLKTSLDLAISSLLLILLSPLLAVIALAIKVDSPGPIFHRRRVLGVGGKAFDAFKFRSMVVNGDEVLDRHPELKAELADNHKLTDDPRITRVGALLRKTSIDELPQLFNVLLGQMSLVGPRMITEEEADQYGRHRHNLLTVKPGITGLWQVSGRSDLSYEERVRLDMYYIRNYTIWRDLQILFIQTPPAVIKRRGAY